MMIYMCDNLGFFDNTEYPEIPYKINNSTIQNYEPISYINNCSDKKGGRSPPFVLFYSMVSRHDVKVNILFTIAACRAHSKLMFSIQLARVD
jgi:hypothetical protein